MQPEDHSIDWGLPQTGDTDHEINHRPLPEYRMLHLRQRSNLLLSRLDSYVLATVRTRHIVTNTVSKSFVETSNGTVEEVIQERRHVRTVREVFPDEDDEEAKHITSYKGNAPVERHTSPANDSESAPEAVHTAPMRTPPLAPRQVVVGNTSQPEPTSDYYPKLDRVEEAAEDDIYSKLSPLSPTPSPITKRTPCGIKSKQSASSGSPLPPGAVLCSRCLSHNQPPSTADAASFVYVRSRSPSARSMSGDPQVEALPKVVATSTVSSVAKCSPRGLAKMLPPPTTVGGIDSRTSARSHSIDSSSPEAFVVVGNESHLTSVHTDPNTWLSGPTPNATAPIAKRTVRAVGLSPPTDEERRRSAIAARKLRADREELNNAPDAFVFIEEPSSSTQEPRAPAKPAVYSRCVSRDNNSRAPSPRPSLSAPCPTPQPGDFKDPLISTAYFRNHVAISAPTSTEIERYKAASSTVRKGA